MAKRRIGVLGGTFNPVHIGHLILAQGAKELLGLEKVIFVPTFHPPHKRLRGLVCAKERYHMLSLAIRSNPDFLLSDIEIKRRGVSYSVETVLELKSKLGKVDLYFIVGSDFLREFSSWKDTQVLRKICRFAVVQRPGYPYQKLPRNMSAIDVETLDISSTFIRKRIKSGRSIRYFVPDDVGKYIVKKKMYR
ncbi:MAG: nicotinate-nucleotide adenylyltransferase [Candidatus Omnitrophica bacterium]|nr:nicotinate-nucleotide adenylyltransferase [Candidatus Omnitrophota bacterium]